MGIGVDFVLLKTQTGSKSKEKCLWKERLLRTIVHKGVQIFLQDVPRLWSSRSPHGGLALHCLYSCTPYFGICCWQSSDAGSGITYTLTQLRPLDKYSTVISFSILTCKYFTKNNLWDQFSSAHYWRYGCLISASPWDTNIMHTTFSMVALGQALYKVSGMKSAQACLSCLAMANEACFSSGDPAGPVKAFTGPLNLVHHL